MAAFLAQMVKDTWKDQGMPEDGINKAVTHAFAEKLMGGVADGYGATFSDPGAVDFDTPDFNMIAALRKNVFQFSAAKNYQELKALSEALLGPDGKVRSFSEFKRIAEQITGEHLRWLKTEYDTAIASGQMASKWVDIQKNKDILPLLEFDAVMDNHTTELCASLNGIIKPIDDPFWDQYYPPNHFNCRSTVRQLAEGTITPDGDINYPEIPDMFRVNLGKRGLVFPPGHPYYDGLPESVKEQGHLLQISDSRSRTRQWAKNTIDANKGLTIPVNRKELSELNLRRGDVKEITGKPHKQAEMIYYLLQQLELVLQRAKYLGSSPDNGSHPDIDLWLYYEIEVGGKKSYLNIMHVKNSNIYRLHSIGDEDVDVISKIKDKA